MSKDPRKEMIMQKMIERQNEAKVVRKIVLVISIILFIAIFLVAGGGYIYVKSALKAVDPDNKKEIPVEIPIGSSITTISKILEENKVIKNAKIFKLYIKIKNEGDFQAGNYKLTQAMTLPEIIDTLKKGKLVEEVVLKITIPEGKQLVQIADIIAEKTNQKKEDVFKQLNDRAFIKEIMEEYSDILTDEILQKDINYPLEGYLFPATYPFYKENPSTEEIIKSMLDKTREVLNDYTGQMEEKEFTPHKLLTMAALIEEEATKKVDREKIASVFYNRIKAGMPLQTDPTVLYALGEHKERTLYKDLEVDSPYNTYKHKGLPPGPIANAGKMSIEAALNPEETDFLYFLATSNGEVIFTKTLDEHNQEKAKHITNKK
ncbi:endolytic transglycosylase MltG [Bacillus aquiflavi]|uniref:Endolytic murein transglycosylase n=1 Tax=Bacillus aquiflavi TaxID=2672567 RepID=A0A6B3W329_9BACI|nr:endolytic transglycosylase MltG [Bacillus aquiflavi]MBA4538534.1 endolytic transglycosylase MltG [Bacillus aquiflavi]NEY82897.1 endolytic transglycosylase MltG [Bacillus aquiflavi]